MPKTPQLSCNLRLSTGFIIIVDWRRSGQTDEARIASSLRPRIGVRGKLQPESRGRKVNLVGQASCLSFLDSPPSRGMTIKIGTGNENNEDFSRNSEISQLAFFLA